MFYRHQEGGTGWRGAAGFSLLLDRTLDNYMFESGRCFFRMIHRSPQSLESSRVDTDILWVLRDASPEKSSLRLDFKRGSVTCGDDAATSVCADPK